MNYPNSILSAKSSQKRILPKPLKDLSINISDSPTSKPQSINSPTAVPQSSKRFFLSKPPSTAPSTPKQSNCNTPKPPINKISSPTNYIFATHNHGNKFSLTPKSASSPKLTEPNAKSSLNPDSLITKAKHRHAVNPQQQHLFNTFQAIKIARSLREPTAEEIMSKQVRLIRRKGWERKKTVVFDLDETLVHCVGANNKGQVEIEIELNTGSTKVGVNIRPYVREMLAAISKDFEVVVFTASHKCYADRVIDFLDPEKQWIHHRLYRNNCILIDGIYVKDLRVLVDRDIRDIVIVDNAAYSFGFQMLNGIPIISWFDDSRDRELFKLIEYLRMLARVGDIRVINQLTFHLDSFYEDYLRDFVAKADKENLNN